MRDQEIVEPFFTEQEIAVIWHLSQGFMEAPDYDRHDEDFKRGFRGVAREVNKRIKAILESK